MLEVLDTMYELNKRREQLTANRVRLTEWVELSFENTMAFSEVRSIYNTEFTLLNDLEHLMSDGERSFYPRSRHCQPSMDELAPFDVKIGLFSKS
jgi:hypothetical protein